MKRDKKKFYIIREDILPESIYKTVLAKEMLARGEAGDIQGAVNRLGIARSTFYKYKDGIHPFFDAGNSEIINILLSLDHVAGVLSGVLNCIASLKANVLTINQSLPLHDIAYVTVSLNIEEMEASVDTLLSKLKGLKGVRRVEIIGEKQEIGRLGYD